MKTWKNRPQKLLNRTKSGLNLNSCSIKNLIAQKIKQKIRQNSALFLDDGFFKKKYCWD